MKLTIIGHPGILKNNKTIVAWPIKGSKKCPHCGVLPKQSGLVMSKQAKKAKTEAVAQLISQWPKPPINEPVIIMMEFYGAWRADKQVDLSNLLQLPEDALEDAGVLQNDSLIVGHDGSRVIRMCGLEDAPCPKRERFKSGARKGELKDNCGAVKQCPFERTEISIFRPAEQKRGEEVWA